jgi:hypothetical protein
VIREREREKEEEGSEESEEYDTDNEERDKEKRNRLSIKTTRPYCHEVNRPINEKLNITLAKARLYGIKVKENNTVELPTRGISTKERKKKLDYLVAMAKPNIMEKIKGENKDERCSFQPEKSEKALLAMKHKGK